MAQTLETAGFKSGPWGAFLMTGYYYGIDVRAYILPKVAYAAQG